MYINFDRVIEAINSMTILVPAILNNNTHQKNKIFRMAPLRGYNLMKVTCGSHAVKSCMKVKTNSNSSAPTTKIPNLVFSNSNKDITSKSLISIYHGCNYLTLYITPLKKRKLHA
jgi:hypothetical protein